jgi:hypothetical protein
VKAPTEEPPLAAKLRAAYQQLTEGAANPEISRDRLVRLKSGCCLSREEIIYVYIYIIIYIYIHIHTHTFFYRLIEFKLAMYTYVWA